MTTCKQMLSQGKLQIRCWQTSLFVC